MKYYITLSALLLTSALYSEDLIQLTPLEESCFTFFVLDPPEHLKTQLTISYTEEGQIEIVSLIQEIMAKKTAINKQYSEDRDDGKRKKSNEELRALRISRGDALKNKYAQYRDLTPKEIETINSLTSQTRDKLTELLNTHSIYDAKLKAFRDLSYEYVQARNELLRQRSE